MISLSPAIKLFGYKHYTGVAPTQTYSFTVRIYMEFIFIAMLFIHKFNHKFCYVSKSTISSDTFHVLEKTCMAMIFHYKFCVYNTL